MPSAPMILNVNEGIKFSFLFPQRFLCFLLPPATRPLRPLPVVVFKLLSNHRRLKKQKQNEKNVFRVADVLERGDGGGEWLFCASAEKYGFGMVFSLIFAVI